MSLSKLGSIASLSWLLSACGSPVPADNPPTTPPVAEPQPSVVAQATAPVADAGPPALKGSFGVVARATTSGKVDKVGEKDGAFKPDGVKDLVFEVEWEGPAAAFFLASVDADGNPTGDFDADTMTGSQEFPPELARAIDQGSATGGIAVYEGDKLLNDKSGSLVPLTDTKHVLTLLLSSKNASKGAYKVYAMLTDRTVVPGPTIAAGSKPASFSDASTKK